MIWETLLRSSNTRTRRRGRFIVVDLEVPHRAITTSVRNGGQTEHLRHLVNHQSCEGSGHNVLFEFITSRGEDAYHDLICAKSGLPPEQAAVMGTAANMNYAAVVTRTYADVEVLAANLAAKLDHWPEYNSRLQQTSGEPNALVTAAIALGWSEKWRPA
jgi:Adenosylcobinamide amidohydrolase